MAEHETTKTEEALRELVADLDRSSTVDEDSRIYSAIRALAEADIPAFIEALQAIGGGYEQTDAIEALVYAEVVDPRFEPIFDAYADGIDAELSKHKAADSERAYAISLRYYVLSELDHERVSPEFLSRLRARASKMVEHPTADVRRTAVTMLVEFHDPSRTRTLDLVRERLVSDPDPLVRAEAYKRLAAIERLPEGAKCPSYPTLFRGLRRKLAGG